TANKWFRDIQQYVLLLDFAQVYFGPAEFIGLEPDREKIIENFIVGLEKAIIAPTIKGEKFSNYIAPIRTLYLLYKYHAKAITDQNGIICTSQPVRNLVRLSRLAYAWEPYFSIYTPNSETYLELLKHRENRLDSIR